MAVLVRGSGARAVFALIGLLASGAPQAGPNDGLRVKLSYQTVHDSNFFRLPDSLPSESETLHAANLALLFDAELGRQVLRFRGGSTAYRYQRFSSLNFDGLSSSAEWQWRMGNDWNGLLSASEQEAPGSYSEAQTRDLRVYKVKEVNRFATANYRLGPVTSLRVARADYSRSASRDLQSTSSRLERQSYEAGVRFADASGSSVGVDLRHSKTAYPVRQAVGAVTVDNSYLEDELRLSLNWLYSGMTSLEARAGLVRRTHEELPERDFEGLRGRFALNWTPSGKSALRGEMWQEFSPQEQLTASYTVNRGARLSWNWAMTGKTALYAAVLYERQDYEGDPGYLLNPGPRRQDTLLLPELRLNYRFGQSGSMSLGYRWGERRSNYPQFGYAYHALQFSAQGEF